MLLENVKLAQREHGGGEGRMTAEVKSIAMQTSTSTKYCTQLQIYKYR